MDKSHTIHAGFAYVTQLADAGWDGVRSALGHVEGPVFSPSLRRAAWMPMAAGATLGAAGARYAAAAKKNSRMALGGAVGTAVGLLAAAAWASRHVAKAAARNAARRINAVRDAHWLELNPIDYA